MYGGEIITNYMDDYETDLVGHNIEAVGQNSTVNIYYGKLISDDTNIGNNFNDTGYSFGGSEVTIIGGDFTAAQEIKSSALYFPEEVTLNISGGTYNAYSGIGVRTGTVNIENATFTCNGLFKDSQTDIYCDGSVFMVGFTDDSEDTLNITVDDSNFYSKYAYVVSALAPKDGGTEAKSYATIKFNGGTYDYFRGDGINKQESVKELITITKSEGID